jgi:hypothetical protein
LHEARYTNAEINGVDQSQEAIAALEARALAGNHKCHLVHGAA